MVHAPQVQQLFVKLPSSGRLIVVSISPYTSVAELTSIVRRRALEVSGEADVPFVLTTRTGKWLDRGYLECRDVGLADQQQLEIRRGCVRLHASEAPGELRAWPWPPAASAAPAFPATPCEMEMDGAAAAAHAGGEPATDRDAAPWRDEMERLKRTFSEQATISPQAPSPKRRRKPRTPPRPKPRRRPVGDPMPAAAKMLRCCVLDDVDACAAAPASSQPARARAPPGFDFT